MIQRNCGGDPQPYGVKNNQIRLILIKKKKVEKSIYPTRTETKGRHDYAFLRKINIIRGNKTLTSSTLIVH